MSMHIFPFLWCKMKSIIIMRTSKHSEYSSVFFWQKKKKLKNRLLYENSNLRVTILKSCQHAFCSGNFCSTHYPDRQRVNDVAHVSAAIQKSGMLDLRKKKREIKQRVSRTRGCEAEGWLDF